MLQGISSKTVDLMSKSTSNKSKLISNYESAWEKFASWSGQRKVDLFYCCIEYVVNFLGERLEKGLEHHNTGSYRSAIYTFH